MSVGWPKDRPKENRSRCGGGFRLSTCEADSGWAGSSQSKHAQNAPHRGTPGSWRPLGVQRRRRIKGAIRLYPGWRRVALISISINEMGRPTQASQPDPIRPRVIDPGSQASKQRQTTRHQPNDSQHLHCLTVRGPLFFHWSNRSNSVSRGPSALASVVMSPCLPELAERWRSKRWGLHSSSPS